MSKLNLEKGRAWQKLKTRESILLAAQQLIESGSDFTLEDVAEKAEISRATIYRYFSNVDMLCAEAALNLNTKSKEALLDEAKDMSFEVTLKHIQNYFIDLATIHEFAFRKYLSVVLDESIKKGNQKTVLRGARRPVVLEEAMKPFKDQMSLKNRRNLKHIITVLSGIEPIIANKDVNRLDNKASKELLKWALEMILKGIGSSKK